MIAGHEANVHALSKLVSLMRDVQVTSVSFRAECTLNRSRTQCRYVCRVEAMQQGTEGTERFCIKQLLKPIDNVRCHGFLCLAPLSGDLSHNVAISRAVVYLMFVASRQAIMPVLLLAAACQHGSLFSWQVYRFCVATKLLKVS